MAKTLTYIPDKLHPFIYQQSMFFVATAPLSSAGRVNLSPKGLDSFRIMSKHQVGYLDLTGSGNETSAHLQENGRITLMFCAFEGKPLILRIYGRGRTILPNEPEWTALLASFSDLPGIRQLIVVDVDQVKTSCGFGVPHYSYCGQRSQLIDWASTKEISGVQDYQSKHNQTSLDGLPTPLAEYLNP